MIEVGVVGGTGYTGKELLRLITKHPKFELSFATSRGSEETKISQIHPNLSGFIDDEFISPSSDLDADLVFTAVPHTKGMEYIPKIREKGIKAIDLSADYRLSVEAFEEYYSTKHTDPGREAVYGLTEYNREEIEKADFVANPGCFPTGALLSVLPLLDSDFDLDYFLFDSKTGVSGAGAKPTQTTHYPNVNDEVSAYNLVSHRHNAEIKKILEQHNLPDFGFTPHIIPMVRGIETTAHLITKQKFKIDELFELYSSFYNNSSFVRIKKQEPKIKSVRGTNYVDLGGFGIEDSRTVILSTIDNLVKGAAGQAIQNANLMFDLDEELGLKEPGLSP
ncbi:N-acetyl-gamma-glutamyl-phosphate reductase [archaeon SCG-AAA382B04]|nr:N-acetyl-gamma-glutamyl-phosphate reductase [archaeon SCG-AAA382B04]